jgi:hypothetical protein
LDCNSVFKIISSLPKQAARQSVPEEKYAFQSLSYKDFEIGVFSDGISGALGPFAAQSSGVKNIASAIFFTLVAMPRAERRGTNNL